MNSNKTLIRIITALLTATLCLSAVSALTSCKKKEAEALDTIGGADGPTSVTVTGPNSDEGKVDDENTEVTEKAAESNDLVGKSEETASQGVGVSFAQDGLYTFANGETVEVPKDVSMYIGTVTEGTMNTVSVEDPSGEVYIYARDESNYANDGEGLLVGDKATVYYEKDITEALFIVTEHNYLAKIDPSWSKVKGKVKDAAMSTVTIELPDGTVFGYERNPAFYSNDGNGITIGDDADVYYVGDLGDKDSFEVRYVYTEKGEDSLGE